MQQQAAVIICGPAANGAVLQVISGVSAAAVEEDPSEFRVGQLFTALQPTFSHDGEWLKAEECGASFGKCAPADQPASRLVSLLLPGHCLEELLAGIEF